MYLRGTLSIDPSQITEIAVKKPTRAFGKMLHFMTMGLVNEKEERETFTALAILQTMNVVLRARGISNIVRLSCDDVDFYLDEEGKTDDLKAALESFETQKKSKAQGVFETLHLVLEHHDDELDYLIAIDIVRVHKVGEYPIQIVVNGIPPEFASEENTTAADLEKRMKSVFRSQKNYDKYIRDKKCVFRDFVVALKNALKKSMGTDDIHYDISTRIVRPGATTERRPELRRARHQDPYFNAYNGFEPLYYYAWLWPEMCCRHDINCHDCVIVDETGAAVFGVGHDGFQAGESAALNPAETIALPAGAAIALAAGGHAYTDIVGTGSPANELDGGDVQFTAWADTATHDASFEVASSCSTCSGCGGGCGGH